MVHRGVFSIVSLSMATLSNKKSASAGTSCDSCHPQGENKKTACKDGWKILILLNG